MASFEINGNTITSESLFDAHKFEIVKKIPAGFFIWNIGKEMGSDEYIPFCEKLYPQRKKNDPNYYKINDNTLKAIKLSREEVTALRNAAHWGVNCKKEAEKALRNKRKGYISDHKRAEAEKTIGLFKRITA